MVFTDYTNQKEVIWQQYRLCLTIAEHQILGGKAENTFLFWDQSQERFGGWKRYNTFRRSTIANGPSCEASNPNRFFIILYWLRVSEWFQQNGKFGNICWFLASCKFEHTKGSNIGLELDQKDVQHALNTCELMGSGKQLILHGNPSALAGNFSPHITVLRRHLLLYMEFQWCMILQGTLGSNFNIFAASGESTAWVLHWKTRSRPIGVRLCPVAQFNFSVPHLIRARGQWLYSGKKVCDVSPSWLHLRTKEEIIPIIHLRQLYTVMILKFPWVRKVHSLRHAFPNLTSRQILLMYHQDDLQLHHLLVEEKERKQETNCVSDCVRDLHRPSLNLFPFQWVMTKMMMISHHKEKSKDNGLDLMSECILTNECRRNHKFNLWILQNLMMKYQMRILRLLVPHHHQLDYHHQLNKGIVPEGSKDLGHVSEYIHVHPRMLVNNNILLYHLLQEYSRIRQLRAKI